MKNKRRDFLKITGLTGLSVASGGILKGYSEGSDNKSKSALTFAEYDSENKNSNAENLSIIGQYGPWASSMIDSKIPSFSFRRKEWTNLKKWRTSAKKRLIERLAIPDIGGTPEITVIKQYDFDGLHIEELRWQLPYGRPTKAIVLKPVKASSPLPGILAFHCHGGNKYFGTEKITRTADPSQK